MSARARSPQGRPAVLHIDTERTWRGGENQIRLLVTHPAATAWEWHLAAPPDSEVVRRLGPHASAIPVRMRGAHMLRAAITLAAYVRAHHISVLACQSSRAHGLGLLVRTFVPSVRLIVHRRVDYAPSASFWSRQKYLSSRIERYVGVSGAVTRVLREYGVAPQRLVTVRDAVDPAPYAAINRPALRARFAAEWQIPNGTPIIGNVAYLTEQKGHDTLLRSLSALRARGEPFFCYIAGGGPLEGALRAQAAAERLDETRLRFLGIRDDVRDLLGATDVFVLASNDEGLGSSLLEAAHAGCALVATRAGGIPEVVIDGSTGLLAPARDPAALSVQVSRMLQDHSLRAALAQAARQHVEQHFSLAAMVEQTLAVYAGAPAAALSS